MNKAPVGIIIDGKTRPSVAGRTFEKRNPATGDLVSILSEGDAADIDLAVAAARRAFEGPWSRFTPSDRQALLLRFAELVDEHFEDIVMTDVLDIGMPITRSRGRRGLVSKMIRYYAGLATSIHGETPSHSLGDDFFAYTVREPVGVCGAITPWNGPAIAAIWKIAPVIVTGCTLVIKPSEEASGATLRYVELLHEAGVPPGVVNVVTGYGPTAGAALAMHPDVNMLSFTGSEGVGEQIIEGSKIGFKRVALELGGKSPNVVFADCDIEAALAGSSIIFANSGQVCTAPTRVLVERPIYDQFVEGLARYANGLKVGNGLDPETQMGPLINARQLDRVTGYMDLGTQEGARAAAGGGRLTGAAYDKGYFVSPTVFAGVDNAMRIAQEEIFGPVVCAIPFDAPEEAARVANDTRYGLAGAVWTNSVQTAHQMSRAIRAGTVWVNSYGPLDPTLPFGGFKSSGVGREQGFQNLDDYLETKSVIMKIA
ncbi:aldehyde dehydrogenase family protein [Sphingomonas histidinilytica]|uniref:aldehyde dehydrogenase family protein n=1 Tax=Rhizorhabdus histidinilytica TaxID=439228 RepID=UPI001ADA5046|nr:aldehyde dehydrogenase family protein [Rhizorhabdus histidinilytica]MBO9379642.1 aldehyde dehydrogenase family protein [Rhizorhabdus histidinilytica]